MTDWLFCFIVDWNMKKSQKKPTFTGQSGTCGLYILWFAGYGSTQIRRAYVSVSLLSNCCFRFGYRIFAWLDRCCRCYWCFNNRRHIFIHRLFIGWCDIFICRFFINRLLGYSDWRHRNDQLWSNRCVGRLFTFNIQTGRSIDHFCS